LIRPVNRADIELRLRTPQAARIVEQIQQRAGRNGVSNVKRDA
jgi:hypothetical protein